MKPTIRIGVRIGVESLPEYKTEFASGADIKSAEETTLAPGEFKAISTGLFFDIPENYEVQIRPRSGLAFKNGITVLNSPGTIDSDYTGEVKIILINHSNEEFYINRGDRIAQMVVAPVIQTEFELVSEISYTQRGEGGFGSTGVN